MFFGASEFDITKAQAHNDATKRLSQVVIRVHDLHKYFQVPIRQRGRFSALRSLLVRRHRLVKAVNGVSFQIGRGELVGYLGPNGAGKSTTIKMLTGLLVPTHGEISVNGRIPWKQREEHVKSLGAVFGFRSTLWWDLPVIESLELLRYIYDVPLARFKDNLREFRKILEMDAFINTPVRSLSLGQRVRADVCAALLHDPSLLFLDEPTIGLDVVAKERIRQFILHANRQRGTTVLLTTHDLSDVEKMCQRVMIIDRGKLLYDGQLESLRQRFGGKRELVVELVDEEDQISIEGAIVTSRQGAQVTFQFDRDQISASELIQRISSNYRIRDLSVREPDLEATIRRIYEQRLLEDAV